jgi:Ni/Co efflux regulator RcnB
MEQMNIKRALTLLVVGMLVAGPAAADKPPGAGGGKSGKNGHRDSDERSKVKTGEYFGDRHRTVVQEYYGEQFRRGHCPPGLAKKNNGCMPPGQAKKWTVGRPLPRDVIYYEVPSALVVRLERPSAGYRYVRVASDILLIAIGTGMVIDAIQDLGRQ